MSPDGRLGCGQGSLTPGLRGQVCGHVGTGGPEAASSEHPGAAVSREITSGNLRPQGHCVDLW